MSIVNVFFVVTGYACSYKTLMGFIELQCIVFEFDLRRSNMQLR